MPPEPVPWDRKDFVLKDRKHERGSAYETLGGGGGGGGSSSSSTSRWREPYHGPRDYPRASPRRPPGHYRQGGNYHVLHGEESRPGDRFWPEDECYRPFFGRYNNSRSITGGGRESRGHFRRSPFWESADFSRAHHDLPPATAPRSIAVPVTPPPPQVSPASREPQNKAVGSADNGFVVDKGPTTGRKSDQDHSLGSISWKPLKWSRSGSFSSLKSARSEGDDSGHEASVSSGKETPIHSSTVNPQEDGLLKKKQRLGWGQGLAKYEKQKVGGSEDVSPKNGLVPCANSSKSTASDTSPKVAALALCQSPATPSSITCVSSPGTSDAPGVKAADAGSDSSDLSVLAPQNCTEEFSIKLKHFEVDPAATLGKLIAGLLQPEDSCSDDTTFTRNATMSKLFLLKEDISEELEKTECDIDMFENELKSLESDVTPALPPVDNATKALGESSYGESMVFVSSSSLKDQMPASVVTPSLSEVEVDIKYADTVRLETSRLKSSEALLGNGTSGSESASSAVVEDAKFGDQVQVSIVPTSGNLNCQTECNLSKLIMSSDLDAEEVPLQLLTNCPPLFDMWKSEKFSLLRKNDVQVKEKLAARKHLMKFKERVLTLKYRVFYHLWKEDLRLLSLRKYRSKSKKCVEPGSHSLQSSSQKCRSSVRSRFALPAGNLTLVPTSEIVDFTNKLLSDSKIKTCRNNLKMPAFILDEGIRNSSFITSNGLIEDPVALETEKATINPWSEEEKEIFMEMLATWGKNFCKIASFLDHKTTADCVEFYYKNHKSDSFRGVRHCLAIRKQQQSLPTNTYLLTSGKRWQREVTEAPLDILGAASVMVAHNNDKIRKQQNSDQASIFDSSHNFKVSHRRYSSLERADGVDLHTHEKETLAADVLAGRCGTLSSEAVSYCITSSRGPAENISSVISDSHLTPKVSQYTDEEGTFSDDGCGELDSADWTDNERSVFIQALSMYGKDFSRISVCVSTRTKEQCKIFFSKARKSLGLDAIYQDPCNGATARSDTNGGTSDMDDAFATEMDSGVCSTQSCSKVDAGFTLSANTSGEDFVHAGNISLQGEMDITSEHHELGIPEHEENDTKVDIIPSKLKNHSLFRPGNNFQTDASPKEISDATVQCNRTLQSGEAADLCVDVESKQTGNCLAPPSETLISSHEYVNFLKSQTVEQVQQQNSRGDCPSVKVENELEMCELQSDFVVKKQMIVDKGLNKVGSQWDSYANKIVTCPENKVNTCLKPIFSPSYLHQMQQDLLPCLRKGEQLISVKQESCIIASVLPDPSSISLGDVHAGLPSNLSFAEHVNKQHHNPVTRKIYQQYLLGNSQLNQVNQTAHVLRGYPLQSLDQQIRRMPDLISGRPVLQENCLKKNGISARSEILCASRREEESHADARTENEQSHLSGDVKLFGTILSNPAPSKKMKLTSHEADGKPSSPCTKRSSSSELSSSQTDVSTVTSVARNSDPIGLDDLQAKSYRRFWDGNAVETGISSLRQPVVMRSKYQLAGLPFYSVQNGLSSGNDVVAEYRQAHTQPFSSVTPLPVSQQQGRVLQRGVNAVVGGGILVGGGAGGCTGASDTLVAIKMQYPAQADLLASDIDSWCRGNR